MGTPGWNRLALCRRKRGIDSRACHQPKHRVFSWNFMADLTTILSSGGLSTLLSGALVFLSINVISERIKASIQHEYDQKLEIHKAQLKAQSDLAIEAFKSQLQITAAERNFQFSHVFQHTADVIVKTYQLLVELFGRVEYYTDAVAVGSAPQEQEEARSKLNQSAEEFNTYFHKNRILFQKEQWITSGSFHRSLNSSRGAA